MSKNFEIPRDDVFGKAVSGGDDAATFTRPHMNELPPDQGSSRMTETSDGRMTPVLAQAAPSAPTYRRSLFRR